MKPGIKGGGRETRKEDRERAFRANKAQDGERIESLSSVCSGTKVFLEGNEVIRVQFYRGLRTNKRSHSVAFDSVVVLASLAGPASCSNGAYALLLGLRSEW